ncbi:MAG: RNase P modulator RnpM [Christensenellales bacterium]
MRMCMGCRERRPKKELLRIVRKAVDGTIIFDPTGRLSGRGTYICADNPECLTKAARSKVLERQLEQPVSQEIYEALRSQLESSLKD